MSDKYNKEEPSVLQKIQNQTGCLFLVIGAAMLAFVLTDLVSSGSSIFGSTENSVGSINGNPVSYEEFNSTYEGMKQQLVQNNPGITIDETIAEQYRTQAWNSLIQAKTIEPQYEQLGITVSPAELEDLTVGANTHPQIQQSFRDPKSNQFDKQRLIQFLKQDINDNPQARESWTSFQEQFTTGLIAEKYQNLVSSSFYTTNLDARNRGKEMDQTVNASIVSIPYAQLSDSNISVSNSEILAYAKKYKSKYVQQASRDIEYIKLDVVPSSKDSVGMMEWAGETLEKFSNTKNDSAFVSIMGSETPFNSAFQIRGSFSPEIENSVFEAEAGKVVGPFQQNGVYSVFKVLDFGRDSLRSVKGSHILFAVAGTDTAKAEKEAREVLAKIKSGTTTFATQASSRNFDATRATGGDMGWVREESRAYSKRLINRLMTSGQGNFVIVRSSRGVHLAKATSAVSRKTVKVAIVNQSIFPSTATDGAFYKKAGEFLGKATGDQSFEEVAESMGLGKRVANKISEKNRSIPNINESDKIAEWLFNSSTEEGSVSGVIDVDGSLVVAKVSKVREEGLPSAEDLRGEIELILKNQKKAEILLPKMKSALLTAKTAEELSKALDAVVTPVPAASFNTGSLPNIGQDYKIIGSILGTPVGKHSNVIEGTTGVAVVFVNNANEYNTNNMDALKNQIKQESEQNTQGGIEAALIEKAEVKDQRYKFYN
jgi:peptidyl-prolyl cis-trans isomerase D